MYKIQNTLLHASNYARPMPIYYKKQYKYFFSSLKRHVSQKVFLLFCPPTARSYGGLIPESRNSFLIRGLNLRRVGRLE